MLLDVSVAEYSQTYLCILKRMKTFTDFKGKSTELNLETCNAGAGTEGVCDDGGDDSDNGVIYSRLRTWNESISTARGL